MKLNSTVRMEPKVFEPASYEIEKEISYTNDNGKQQENVCAVDSIARWRFAESKGSSVLNVAPGLADSGITAEMVEGNQKVESNAKLIEWSDGSYGLAVGDEIFEIREEDLPNCFVFLKHEKEFAISKG